MGRKIVRLCPGAGHGLLSSGRPGDFNRTKFREKLESELLGIWDGSGIVEFIVRQLHYLSAYDQERVFEDEEEILDNISVGTLGTNISVHTNDIPYTNLDNQSTNSSNINEPL